MRKLNARNKMPEGFTLLEILVAMAILAFVTLFTSNAIQTALKNRAKVQKDIEQTGGLRDALKVMENDINHAFNHRDINIALYNAAAKERNKKIEEAKNGGASTIAGGGSPPPITGGTGASTNPYASMEPMKIKEEKILTQFIGEAEKLNFTSLSNARISSDERTSDQAEIGYQIRDCKSRRDRKQATKCLSRRVSTFIDEDITTGGEETNLLEDVSRLEFRYLGPGGNGEWVTRWVTNDSGDDVKKNIFPFAVEVTVEVQPPKDTNQKPMRMTMVAGIRNPNNAKKEDATTTEGQTAK